MARMNPSALVDSSSFRHENELVLSEDLIINSSSCGLNNELVHLWTYVISKHPFIMNLSTCGLCNKLIHLWT